MYSIRNIGKRFSREEYADLIQGLLEYVDAHSMNKELFLKVLKSKYEEKLVDRILQIKEHLCGSNVYDLNSLCELLYIVDESQFDEVKLPFLLYCDKQTYCLSPQQLRSALSYCHIVLSQSDVDALTEDLCNNRDKATDFNQF